MMIEEKLLKKDYLNGKLKIGKDYLILNIVQTLLLEIIYGKFNFNYLNSY